MMTSIRIDGSSDNLSAGKPAPYVYAIPINSTSAINVHLTQQQQLQQLQQFQLLKEQGVSASTYVTVTPIATQTDNDAATTTQDGHQQAAAVQADIHMADAHTTGVHTAMVHTAGVQATGVQTINMNTDPPVESTSTNTDSAFTSVRVGSPDHDINSGRNVLYSFGSNPDSNQDDANSVNSFGSRGTGDSLPEDMQKGFSSLSMSPPPDERTTSPTGSAQREFLFGHSHSLTESFDSQKSNSDGPYSPKAEKQVTFQRKWPLSWDEEDAGSELSSSWGSQFDEATTFILDDFTEAESKAAEDAEALKATRVALLRGQNMTAMLKVKCSSEEMGFDLRVITLLQDILTRCDQLGQKMKGSAVRLTPFHLNKMKLNGRPAKERAAEVSRMLGGDVILCEAVCQKHADRIHISTQVLDKVYDKGPFVVGKLGILATLWKKHKYAVATEFSEPLCNHIHFYRPHLLGSTNEVTLKRKRKATDTVKRVFQSRELLSQMFKNDPTITVAEAARRSFVEIIFYALYE